MAKQTIIVPTCLGEKTELPFSFDNTGSHGGNLGCHAAIIVSPMLTIPPEITKTQFTVDSAKQRKQIYNEVRANPAVHKQIVLAMAATVKHVSHVVFSCNMRTYRASDSMGSHFYIYRTAEILEMLMDLCDADPKTYGTYVRTAWTENMNHPDGAAECTVVWIPPHVLPTKWVQKDTYKSLTADYLVEQEAKKAA